LREEEELVRVPDEREPPPPRAPHLKVRETEIPRAVGVAKPARISVGRAERKYSPTEI
jgi:hypothetical protein